MSISASFFILSFSEGCLSAGCKITSLIRLASDLDHPPSPRSRSVEKERGSSCASAHARGTHTDVRWACGLPAALEQLSSPCFRTSLSLSLIRLRASPLFPSVRLEVLSHSLTSDLRDAQHCAETAEISPLLAVRLFHLRSSVGATHDGGGCSVTVPNAE